MDEGRPLDTHGAKDGDELDPVVDEGEDNHVHSLAFVDRPGASL